MGAAANWGRQIDNPRRGSQIGRPAKEGRAKSDDPQRGARQIGRPAWRRFFLLGQYFPKPDFYVYGVFWAILIFVSKGQGEKIGRGGGGGSENILDLVIPESLT